jgi:hypothetical protein
MMKIILGALSELWSCTLLLVYELGLGEEGEGTTV